MANIKITATEKEFVRSMKAMSGSVGELAGKLSIDLARGYRDADRQQRIYNQGLGRFTKEITQSGQALTMNLTLPLAAASAAAIKFFGDIQAIEKGLTVIEGSADKAAKAMSSIREIAKMPGLGIEEASSAYNQLRAVGFEAEKAKKTIMEFGNALAISGKGKAEFGSIMNQLVQMGSKPKVLAEDLKPILNSAPIVAKILRDTFQTVDSEQISAILQKNGQSTSDFISLLVGKLSELDRANGGVKNSIENFGDSLKISGANIGEMIEKTSAISQVIDSFGSGLESATEGLKTANPFVQNMIVGLGGLALASGPVITGIGFISSSVLPLLKTGLVALAGPVGVIVAGLAAIGAGTAIYISHQRKLEDMARATMTVEEASKRSTTQYNKERDEINKLISVLENNKSTTIQMANARNRLVEINGEFSKSIKNEKVDIDNLKESADKYLKSLKEMLKGKMLYDAYLKNQERQAAIKKDPFDSMSLLDKGKSLFKGLTENRAAGILGIYKAFIGDAGDIAREQLNQLSKAKDLIEADKQFQDYVESLFGGGSSSTVKSKTGGNTSNISNAEQIKKALTQSVNTLKVGANDDFGPFWDTYLSALFGEDKWDAKMKSSVAKLNEKIANELKKLPQSYGEKAAETLMEMQSSMASSLQMTGANFVEQLAAGIASGQGLDGAFASLLGSVGDMVSRIGKEFLVIDKLLKFAKSVLGTAPGPGAAIALIAAGGIMKGLASSAMQRNGVRAFAQGGIIQGPTLGLMGEYPGASSNPEVVAPLDKLKNLIKPQQNNQLSGVLVTEISGEKLRIILERADRKRNG